MAIRIAVWLQGLFPDLSLLADTESDINRLRCATLKSGRSRSRSAEVLGRHRHSNYDVITSPALGGGMYCHSASS